MILEQLVKPNAHRLCPPGIACHPGGSRAFLFNYTERGAIERGGSAVIARVKTMVGLGYHRDEINMVGPKPSFGVGLA